MPSTDPEESWAAGPKKSAPLIQSRSARRKARCSPKAGVRSARGFFPISQFIDAVEVTVSVKVVECITEPDVAVTVTVDGVELPEVGVPVLAVVVEVLLQPTNSVRAATVRGSSISSRSPRRPRRRTKHRANARDEPESSSPEPARMAAAVGVAALMVRVALIEPDEDTATAPKLQVDPAGRPVQLNVTAELVEKPFCGSTVTLVVALLPVATVTAFGVTANMKSGMGAPVAGTMALA